MDQGPFSPDLHRSNGIIVDESRFSLRRRAVVILAALMTLWAGWNARYALRSEPVIDPATAYAIRFAEVRKELRRLQVHDAAYLGFHPPTDSSIEASLWPTAAQYAMAPVVLNEHRPSRYVVADFADSATMRRFLDDTRWTVVTADYEMLAALLDRGESR